MHTRPPGPEGPGAPLGDFVDATALGELVDNHAYYDVERVSDLPPA